MNEILHLLKALDVWQLIISTLDILLVAYLFYRILMLLKGTGATYILLGLLVVAGVYIGAHWLRLSTLSWLLDHVISYIILIMIIVFQADIRRGLMRVGRRMFLFGRTNVDIAVIEEVVLVCETLAKKRVGALIVFERETEILGGSESGTLLEAQVCKELLVNIFSPWPNNQLHDGAVIIRNNHIRKVAAVLPLSRNPNLHKSLGTRHRAAIGVTEETDAIAVVVSEQRGKMSLCVAGKIHLFLTKDKLRSELISLLHVPEKNRLPWLSKIVKRVETSVISESTRVGERDSTGRFTISQTLETKPTITPSDQKEEV